MKKLLSLLLCALLLSTTALADVLVEVKDDFWETHHQECESVYREYIANGQDGYVTLYESPASPRQRENVPNGVALDGQWHYTDSKGRVWLAVYDGHQDGYNLCRGWVDTADLAAQPDHTSFVEAHQADFMGWDTAYDGAFADVQTVVAWKYPGSGQVVADQLEARWFRDNVTPADALQTCYVDKAGRFWGLATYIYGLRNVWICVSDPTATDLPVEADAVPPQPARIPAAETLPAPTGAVSATVLWLVLAVMVVTAGLIFLLFRKKQPKDRA